MGPSEKEIDEKRSELEYESVSDVTPDVVYDVLYYIVERYDMGKVTTLDALTAYIQNRNYQEACRVIEDIIKDLSHEEIDARLEKWESEYEQMKDDMDAYAKRKAHMENGE